MNQRIKDMINELKSLGDPKRAENYQRFFKTGKGEYGEGDLFLGIQVPVLRNMSKKYREISLEEIADLIASPYHEIRMFSLFLLIYSFKKSNGNNGENIYKFYLKNSKFINNWDLVDSSAEHIVGAYLYNFDRQPIYKLAVSKSLWERRISIISTYYFIKQNQFDDTLKISEILLRDKEDLIHKAVGWMLREVGKRNIENEELFLKKHYKTMPRTMLRYAIEKFPEEKRREYLYGSSN
ncbi:MAG: DNA alkylation repair protein [Desulfobacterales bacterium]|nr:DNA alkylation repair protein [Desulfobacterales bacterium]